jgi:hypothetical protein
MDIGATLAKALALTALVTSAAACNVTIGGGGNGGDGARPAPVRPVCLARGGHQAVQRIKLTCFAGTVPAGQADCLFFVNAANASGSAPQFLNVAPAFFTVPEGRSVDVDLLLTSGFGNVSLVEPLWVQATQTNCKSQSVQIPCQPMEHFRVNVVNAPSTCNL